MNRQQDACLNSARRHMAGQQQRQDREARAGDPERMGRVLHNQFGHQDQQETGGRHHSSCPGRRFKHESDQQRVTHARKVAGHVAGSSRNLQPGDAQPGQCRPPCHLARIGTDGRAHLPRHDAGKDHPANGKQKRRIEGEPQQWCQDGPDIGHQHPVIPC